MVHTGSQEKTSKKLYPFLAAAFPWLISGLLFIQVRHRYGQDLSHTISANRSSVQILVQIISHGLGLLQTYSVCTSQKYSIRLRLFKKSVRLDKFGYWIALLTNHVDLSLPPKHLALVLVAVSACIAPGALWAGAITPLTTSKQSSNMNIHIPSYTQSSATFWNAEFYMDGYELWADSNSCQGSGLVSTCPVPALQGNLLSSAGSATPATGEDTATFQD